MVIDQKEQWNQVHNHLQGRLKDAYFFYNFLFLSFTIYSKYALDANFWMYGGAGGWTW